MLVGQAGSLPHIPEQIRSRHNSPSKKPSERQRLTSDSSDSAESRVTISRFVFRLGSRLGVADAGVVRASAETLILAVFFSGAAEAVGDT